MALTLLGHSNQNSIFGSFLPSPRLSAQIEEKPINLINNSFKNRLSLDSNSIKSHLLNEPIFIEVLKFLYNWFFFY